MPKAAPPASGAHLECFGCPLSLIETNAKALNKNDQSTLNLKCKASFRLAIRRHYGVFGPDQPPNAIIGKASGNQETTVTANPLLAQMLVVIVVVVTYGSGCGFGGGECRGRGRCCHFAKYCMCLPSSHPSCHEPECLFTKPMHYSRSLRAA